MYTCILVFHSLAHFHLMGSTLLGLTDVFTGGPGIVKCGVVILTFAYLIYMNCSMYFLTFSPKTCLRDPLSFRTCVLWVLIVA